MFDITVKYLGFLKHIPVLPQLFDGIIKLQTFLSNKQVLDYVDEIESEILSWENTSASIHKFGGLQFDVKNKEIGHIHGNGLLDILFSREIKMDLLKNGSVKEHHTFKDSGWISFLIRKEEDKKYAIELLRRSYLLKR